MSDRAWNVVGFLLILASCINFGCVSGERDFTDSGLECTYDCLQPDWYADEQCKLHGECGVW
jgi:hypothetical protein